MDAVEPANGSVPETDRCEPSGHRSFYLGTPPPPEAEAMMSIQTLHLTVAALPVILVPP
jgi:hypothetical protein